MILSVATCRSGKAIPPPSEVCLHIHKILGLQGSSPSSVGVLGHLGQTPKQGRQWREEGTFLSLCCVLIKIKPRVHERLFLFSPQTHLTFIREIVLSTYILVTMTGQDSTSSQPPTLVKVALDRIDATKAMVTFYVTPSGSSSLRGAAKLAAELRDKVTRTRRFPWAEDYQNTITAVHDGWGEHIYTDLAGFKERITTACRRSLGEDCQIEFAPALPPYYLKHPERRCPWTLSERPTFVRVEEDSRGMFLEVSRFTWGAGEPKHQVHLAATTRKTDGVVTYIWQAPIFAGSSVPDDVTMLESANPFADTNGSMDE